MSPGAAVVTLDEPDDRLKVARVRWEKLVRGSVCCRPGTEQMVSSVAERLAALEAAGTPSCVWHEVSVETGRLATCPCAPCTLARRAEVGR